MSKKVYVSSTNDLYEFRDAVRWAIQQLGMTPVMWEDFRNASGNQTPSEAMRSNIMESDFFLGIYGLRYGSIPQVDLNEKPNSTGKSYIELEYDTARETQIPCLPFFLPKGWEQLPPEHMEGEPGKSKLDAFRDKVLNECVASFYKNPDELLINALIRLAKETQLPDESIAISPRFGKPSTDTQFIADIFMVMPFGTEVCQNVYNDHIKKVVSKLGCEIKRGDDFFAKHSIIQDIWAGIYNARLVIADCTGKNANVFYEIAIAHMLNKPTILITNNIDDIPFDIRDLRAIS